MRTEQEVRLRLEHLLGAELERRVQETTERVPTRCVHNHRQALDSRRQVEGLPNPGFNILSREGKVGLPVIQTIGLCLLGVDDPNEWRGTICDEPIDAKRCPDYTPFQTKDELLAAFKQDLQDTEWVQTNMPEVHGLLWTLGYLEAPALPWWRRVWYFFLRIQVEAIQPPFDPTPLLQAIDEGRKDDLCSLFGIGCWLPSESHHGRLVRLGSALLLWAPILWLLDKSPLW